MYIYIHKHLINFCKTMNQSNHVKSISQNRIASHSDRFPLISLASEEERATWPAEVRPISLQVTVFS